MTSPSRIPSGGGSNITNNNNNNNNNSNNNRTVNQGDNVTAVTQIIVDAFDLPLALPSPIASPRVSQKTSTIDKLKKFRTSVLSTLKRSPSFSEKPQAPAPTKNPIKQSASVGDMALVKPPVVDNTHTTPATQTNSNANISNNNSAVNNQAVSITSEEKLENDKLKRFFSDSYSAEKMHLFSTIMDQMVEEVNLALSKKIEIHDMFRKDSSTMRNYNDYFTKYGQVWLESVFLNKELIEKALELAKKLEEFSEQKQSEQKQYQDTLMQGETKLTDLNQIKQIQEQIKKNQSQIDQKKDELGEVLLKEIAECFTLSLPQMDQGIGAINKATIKALLKVLFDENKKPDENKAKRFLLRALFVRVFQPYFVTNVVAPRAARIQNLKAMTEDEKQAQRTFNYLNLIAQCPVRVITTIKPFPEAFQPFFEPPKTREPLKLPEVLIPNAKTAE